MTVAELLTRWKWREMDRQPGRFVLAEPQPHLSMDELLGADVPTAEVPTTGSGDLIVTARLEDGGLVSYRRADGTWLHTLNTARLFRQKLWNLGIEKMPIAEQFGEWS